MKPPDREKQARAQYDLYRLGAVLTKLEEFLEEEIYLGDDQITPQHVQDALAQLYRRKAIELHQLITFTTLAALIQQTRPSDETVIRAFVDRVNAEHSPESSP